jgi:hypothetical protein
MPSIHTRAGVSATRGHVLSTTTVAMPTKGEHPHDGREHKNEGTPPVNVCVPCMQLVRCGEVLTLLIGVPQSSPGMSVTSTLLLPGVLDAWVARNSARLNATSRDRSHSHCTAQHTEQPTTRRPAWQELPDIPLCCPPCALLQQQTQRLSWRKDLIEHSS